MPCSWEVPCPLLRWTGGCLAEFPALPELQTSLLLSAHAAWFLLSCPFAYTRSTEKLRFLMCEKSTSSCAPAAPSPCAGRAGPRSPPEPPTPGAGASGQSSVLPVRELQDQDRSAEGAPHLWSGGRILRGPRNASAKLCPTQPLPLSLTTQRLASTAVVITEDYRRVSNK